MSRHSGFASRIIRSGSISRSSPIAIRAAPLRLVGLAGAGRRPQRRNNSDTDRRGTAQPKLYWGLSCHSPRRASKRRSQQPAKATRGRNHPPLQTRERKTLNGEEKTGSTEVEDGQARAEFFDGWEFTEVGSPVHRTDSSGGSCWAVEGAVTGLGEGATLPTNLSRSCSNEARIRLNSNCCA